jgi:hypothetical protein
MPIDLMSTPQRPATTVGFGAVDFAYERTCNRQWRTSMQVRRCAHGPGKGNTPTHRTPHSRGVAQTATYARDAISFDSVLQE